MTRTVSAAFLDELCVTAAREACPAGMGDAEILFRACVIRAFIYGYIDYPSRSLH